MYFTTVASGVTRNRIDESGSQNYCPKLQAWSILPPTTTNTNFWTSSELLVDMYHTVGSSLYPDRLLPNTELLIVFPFQGLSNAPERPFVKAMRLAVGGSYSAATCLERAFLKMLTLHCQWCERWWAAVVGMLTRESKKWTGSGATLLCACTGWGVNSVLGYK